MVAIRPAGRDDGAVDHRLAGRLRRLARDRRMDRDRPARGARLMAKTTIPQKTQSALWARAGGRCEYRGCNEDLIGDLVAGREDGKFGFIAHIVADSADGPRGDPVRSPALRKDLNNLMLLCAKHHKGVDVDYLADHPESVLLEMKAEHEDRIAIVTGMAEDRAAHVLRFAADIG